MFTAATIELWLRVAILRAGGTMIVEADTDEMDGMDDVILFAEATESGRGVKLTAVRIGEAGHA
jgi:hypothetical protein